jgi:tRNA U55 pseudouridine synthase TruB
MFRDGIVLIKKRSEWTSRDVVNKACKILNTKKIGHCGTLDPLATGLLILGINKGTIDIEKALQISVDIVKLSGMEFVEKVTEGLR